MRTLRSVHQPIHASEQFSRADVATAAESALHYPPSTTLVEQVVEATGGVPWLVQLVLGVLSNQGSHSFTNPAVSREVVDRVGRLLDTDHEGLRELLLALAVGFDLSGHLPVSLAGADLNIDDLVTRAREAGLLFPDGRLVPLVQLALMHTTPGYRVHALQLELVDAIIDEGRPLDDVAEELSRAGLREPRIATALERAADAALATQPATAFTLYEEAAAAGSDELSTAARRAQAAFATGDLDLAARIVDDLLTCEDPPDLSRAVDVAAAVWARRGMLQRSADIYRWLGPTRVGSSAPLAAVALLGAGDREGSEAMRDATAARDTPTLLSVAMSLMAEGVRDSVVGPYAGALPALIRASDMMSAAAVSVPVPEQPAALAALVALHSGELGVADRVLEGALEAEQGGPAAQPRLLLLRAWVAMQANRPEPARSAIRLATEDARGLAPRDELLLRALEVGLARRTDDAPALVRSWQKARESVLHVPIDLFSLMPLGELAIAATRLRDSAWLEVPLDEAWGLLDRLGNPPLWAVPLHWSVAQSAILADKPADLAPHAAALVRASPESHLASVLAAAGRAWVAVRAGRFAVAAVEEAARGLASVGQVWDGSRLAGHAAARTEERKDMARLLACARSLHSSAPSSTAPEAQRNSPAAPSAEGGTVRDEHGLSAREREVAQLVLEGNTYDEIGEAIFISPRTVEHHVARIRRQLGVTTRSEMLARLRQVLGSGDLPTE